MDLFHIRNQNGSFRRALRGALLGGLAAASVIAPTAALAGGGHYYGHGGRYYAGKHFRGGHFYGPRPYFRGYYGRPGRYGRYGRHYRRHRGGISGAEAALIATGIIGGVILIDRALERDARRSNVVVYTPYPGRIYNDPRYDRLQRDQRYYDDRYYLEDERARLEDERRRLEEERRTLEADRRSFQRNRDSLDLRRRDLEDAERRLEQRARELPPAGVRNEDLRDFDEQRFEEDDFDRREIAPSPVNPAPRLDQDEFNDGLDGELLGQPSAAELKLAFDACAAETRRAAAAEGLVVALPNAPAQTGPIDRNAYRLTAAFTAQTREGAQYRRTMQCEADKAGVRYLEII